MLFKCALNKINNNKQETGINHCILQCIFTNKFKVINITDSVILKRIKAYLWSRNK